MAFCLKMCVKWLDCNDSFQFVAGTTKIRSSWCRLTSTWLHSKPSFAISSPETWSLTLNLSRCPPTETPVRKNDLSLIYQLILFLIWLISNQRIFILRCQSSLIQVATIWYFINYDFMSFLNTLFSPSRLQVPSKLRLARTSTRWSTIPSATCSSSSTPHGAATANRWRPNTKSWLRSWRTNPESPSLRWTPPPMTSRR